MGLLGGTLLSGAPVPIPNLKQVRGDPLPAVGPCRPSGAELARQPRAHPYLFFTAAERDGLRAKLGKEPFASLGRTILAAADADLDKPLPAMGRAFDGIPRFLPNGDFNPEWLKHNYDDFYHQAYLLRDTIPTLGFAYQLTGDPKYATAGKRWLLEFAGRPKYARKEREADFDAAYVAYAFALGYDWLAETLTEPERAQVRGAFHRLAEPMLARARTLLANHHPQGSRDALGNNHANRTHGLFALTPLAILDEDPAAAGWLDLETQLLRDRLAPSAWAPDGEHIDTWDHFESSLEDPMAFFVALRHVGGEDLLHNPRLESRYRGIARFYLYGLEARWDHKSGQPAWLALAHAFHDPVAQWIATRGGSPDPGDPIHAFLFDDPSVVPQPPVDPAGSIYFPYLGMVKLATNWQPKGILVPFRCGPEIGKDVGDQNGFRLRAGGEWLLPRLPIAHPPPGAPEEARWDFEAWFRPAAQNVILTEPQGIGDLDTYLKTGRVPMQGGFQVAAFPPSPGHHGDQWLAGTEVPPNGDLRVVAFSPAADFVAGEAHRAFAYDAPARWVRRLLFVKGAAPYVLVCDEVRAAAKPVTVAWQLASGVPVSSVAEGVVLHGKHGTLAAQMLAPSGTVPLIRTTPAPIAKERTPYVQWRTAGPVGSVTYVAALVPLGQSPGPAPTVRSIASNDGAAVEVTSAAGRDVVVFETGGDGATLRRESAQGGDLTDVFGAPQPRGAR